MKKAMVVRALSLVASLLLLAGCASGPSISSQIDPQADFSGFRTYAFFSPLAIEPDGYETMASTRLRAAVRQQMESRGYAYDEKAPDLWVNINGNLQQRTSVSTMPTVDYAYYYSYRARGYYAVPYWRDEVHVSRYTEGTVNIDLVDAKRKRMVWTGIAVGRVSRMDTEERNARIDNAVAEIFARYPHRADGTSQ